MNPEERNAKMMEQMNAPHQVRALPYDKRGFPIPHVVLRSEEGTPSFIVNNAEVQIECLQTGRCSVCGHKMEYGDFWMVGGPKSAYDPRGAYADLPMHHDCGAFALKVCPYLATSFSGVDPGASRERYLERLSKSLSMVLEDPTVDSNKPKVFVFAQLSGMAVTTTPTSLFNVVPNRPWLAIEHWKDGECILTDDYEMQQHYLSLYKQDMIEEGLDMKALPKIMQAANQNLLKGVFSWDLTTKSQS